MTAVLERGFGARAPSGARVAVLHVLGSAALLVFAGTLGAHGLALDHLGGLLACAALTRLGWTRGPRVERTNQLALLVIGLGWVPLVFSQDRSAWLFGVAAILAGLALRARALDSSAPATLRSLALLAWLFAAWFLFRTSSAAGWRAANWLASSASQVVGAPFGLDLRLGATAAGIDIALLHTAAIGLQLAERWQAARVSLTRPVVMLSIPWILQAAHLANVCVLLRNAGPDVNLAGLAGSKLLLLRAGVDWTALFLLILMLRRAHYEPRAEEVAAPARRWIVRLAHGCAAVALLALVGHEVAWRHALADARPGRLIVVADAGASELPGNQAGLWRRAASYGFSAQPYARGAGVPEIVAQEPGSERRPAASKDVFVVPFPAPKWLVEEAPHILQAVQSGAGLLVLGDHTNALDSADSLAPLLEPLGFALGFDSIDPVTGRWFDSMELHRHPLAPHWPLGGNMHYAVGASVVVPWDGEILALGRYALADLGDPQGIPGNYIGDRRFGPGDVLGDSALVASAPHGAGRVVVAGDPEFLLNESLPDSAGLARALLAYACAAPPRWVGSNCLRWLGLALLGAASLLYCASRRALPWPAAALGLGCWVIQAPALHPAPYVGHAERQVLMDIGFRGAYPADKRMPGLLDGLVGTLEDEGFVVELGRLEDPELDAAAAAILVAPYGPLSSRQEAALLDFVRQGKTLLVSIGYRHGKSVAGLLEVAGIRVLPQILGRAFEASSDAYATSNPLIFREAYALGLSPATGARAMYSTPSGEIVIAEARVGAGRIVVIGDPSFLLGGSLSADGRAVPQNQAMLLAALSDS